MKHAVKAGAKERERRDIWLGSESSQLPLVFSLSFFFAFRSLFYPDKSHLGLVVDRQHDLVDAGVLEGLFWGE